MFTAVIPSAPASATATAMRSMWATLGESFTKSGFEVLSRAAETQMRAFSGSVEKGRAPPWTLGQERLSSMAWTTGSASRMRVISRYSSIDSPPAFVTITVSASATSGIVCSR